MNEIVSFLTVSARFYQILSKKGVEYKKQAEDLKQISIKYNTITQGVRDMGEKYRDLSEKLELIQVISRIS